MINLDNESEIYDLFEREIVPHLDNLEQQRSEAVTVTNRLWKKAIALGVLPAALIVSAICYFFSDLGSFGIIAVTAIAAIIFTFLAHGYASSPSKEYELQIRDRFMELVCKAIGDLTYHQSGTGFDLSRFREYKLISSYHDADLEDELRGVHRGYKFSMVEADLSKETTDHSDDHSSNRSEVVFSGLLIILDSPLSFNGSVLITRERGKFINKIKEVFRAGETVKIPDTDFEAIYEVYATDVESTLQLFTPTLIKLLKQLPEIVDAQVQLAFDNGKILIAAKDTKPFLNRFSVKMDTIH